MRWPFGAKPDKPRQTAPVGTVEASGDRSIAIDTQGGPFLGVASTGDSTTIVHVPPQELRAPAEVDAPSGLVKLPGRHTGFVGREVLGEDHPSTLASRSNLAAAYESAEDLGRAIPLYQRALEDTVRVLGQDQPGTRIVTGNLAAALEARRSDQTGSHK